MNQASPLGVVFDMDDTLYLERDYVRSGFQAVAAAVTARSHIAQDDAFTFLWSLFEAGTRGTTFNDLLERYPTLRETFTVPDLVKIYREHAPTIHLLPEMKVLLETLRGRGVSLGVITDGPYTSQRAKADALGLEDYVDTVILTDTWGKAFWKPHPKAFEAAAESLGLPHEQLVYIGDNPAKDFHAPAQLGWQSVRLRLPEQLRVALELSEVEPTYEARSISDLRTWLFSQLS